jgi:hypothetical protein
MIDYHRDNVAGTKVDDYRLYKKAEVNGQKAFVSFKLQLFECLDLVEEVGKVLDQKLSRREIMDVAYMMFYYGIGDDWKPFSKQIFKRYDPELLPVLTARIKEIKQDEKKPKDLGKTNQTSLSSYFRNMYNAIMLIHANANLTRSQRKEYIKILRAQLSNEEQALLYFNVMSRFGKKWIDSSLIVEYELIKNLPEGYCGKNYDFKEDFKMDYEDDEIDVALIDD